MKVTLSKVEATEVEVDIPDECPGCGADLTGVGGELTEEALTATSQPVELATAHSLVDAEYGGDDVCYDIQYVTGYRCTKCNRQLVSTEA